MVDEFGRTIPILDMRRWQYVKINLINLLVTQCTFNIIFKKIIITDKGAIVLCGYPSEESINKLQMLRNQIKVIHANHNIPTKTVSDIFHITIGKILPQNSYNEYNISQQNYESLTKKIMELNETLQLHWSPSTISIIGSHSPILESAFTEVKLHLKSK